jgi:hypothetical protein
MKRISQRDRPAGVEHLGIQVSDRAELDEVYERLRKAGKTIGAACCD